MGRMEFSITECIGVLKFGDYPIELNLIAWGAYAPKYDLRTWKRDGDKKIPCRGLTLNLDELRALKHILDKMEVLENE